MDSSIKTQMNIIKPIDRVSLAAKIGKPSVDKVVDDFYNRIQIHPTLSEPFSIVGHWDEHKEKISQFWWVALGGNPSNSYSYDPVGKHFTAGFTQNLLNDWKTLFFEVLTTHLTLELAYEWQKRVEMIGENLLRQNDRLNERDHNNTQI